MKIEILSATLFFNLFLTGLVQAQPDATETKTALSPGLESRLKEFFADKELQVKRLAEREKIELPEQAREYFEAAANGDWLAVADHYDAVRELTRRNDGDLGMELRATLNGASFDTRWGYDEAKRWEEKYFRAFGRDIIDSIPAGSIYFGGTDPGRYVITALSRSHAAGDPFFTITQNALADGMYLTYVREMYGGKIATPTSEDSQKAFQDYLADAQKRLKDGKLKPGEDVRMEDNRVQVSGQVAVMGINGLLVKTIFDQNPGREFYVEESFPLDWMYPHLSAHGLILKLNREPIVELSEETVRKDRDYWVKYLKPILGDWLQEGTTMKDLCEFADKIFARKDIKDFAGEPKFFQNGPACKTFSKLRSSQGGVFAWRAEQAKSNEERERMRKAADFAFRQAFALCPYSPEAVMRYANLLKVQGRLAEATLLADTALKVEPGNRQFAKLAADLKRPKTPEK